MAKFEIGSFKLRKFLMPARYYFWDTAAIALSLFVATYLRMGHRFDEYLNPFLLFLPAVIVVRVASLYFFGAYRVMWRYFSASDVMALVEAIGLSTLILIAASFMAPAKLLVLPRSVYFIDAAISLLLLLAVRLNSRMRNERAAKRGLVHGRRTIIYGAGNNGRLLAQRFRSDTSLGVHLVGFIDDDRGKFGAKLSGVPVLGSRADLKDLIEAHNVTELIIALPALPGELLREVVLTTRQFNIRPHITSRLTELSSRTSREVDIYRQIDLADLLNRPRREMDLTPVRDMIRGKRVLVTGAGGSIGSELARQILSYEPSCLILLDHSEFNLYAIDKELRLSTNDMERVVPLLIDLKERASMKNAFAAHAPEVVFHAAAYKHVHLVESNPFSSILNNILGTKILLECCREAGIRTFVQISTDKAVNPVGVMGMTKRVCELLVTEQALSTGFLYCSVRFGNVLGSSGSLVPLLQSQVLEGGPITITHRDMTRFFMLIPEAVSLVLKAATIARPGDINVLKMGEPVKIVDIARSILALYGKTEEDVPIIFTGLRPGEKMFEELYIRGDELQTENPDILILPNGDSHLQVGSKATADMLAKVDSVIEDANRADGTALTHLKQLARMDSLSSGDEFSHV